MVAQGPVSSAPRAAATALSTSAVDASGVVAMTCSVCGEMTSIVPPPSDGTQSPPIQSVSRS